MPNKRLPVTIQLSPIKDKSLIDKINKLPHGTRNGELKEKLAIGFGSNPTEDLEREIVELRREVEQLRSMVAAIPNQIKAILSTITINAAPQVDAPAPEQPRISDEEIQKREANLKKRSW